MNAGLFIALSLAGGLGAACRLLVDGAIRSRFAGPLPLGTITINLTGSFALGLVAGLTASAVLPESIHLIAGAGFLGGYTTFSTSSFEGVRLAQDGESMLGLVNAFGVLVAATALAGLGLWLGSLA